MTSENNTTKIKWPKLLAKILALLWAGFWIWFGLASGIGEKLTWGGVIIHTAIPGLILLIPALLSLKWEKLGGTLLIIFGIIILVLYPMVARNMALNTIFFVLLTMALPPILAGILLLATWRR